MLGRYAILLPLLLVPFVASATPPSFSYFGYEIKENAIYCGHISSSDRNPIDKMKKIEGADVGSFESLKGGAYHRDKNNAYYQCNKIPGAAGETFSFVIDAYAKDRDHVYYKGVAKQGFDGVSFVYLGYGYLKDKNGVYWIGSSHPNEPPHPEAPQKISQANANFFTVKKGFATDNKNLYCNGKPIVGADSSTFSIIQPATGDANSLRVSTAPYPHAKDKSRVYICSPHERNVLQDSDPDTFVMVDEIYSKDKNHVYHFADMTEYDPATFAILEKGFVRDEYSLGDYYSGNVISNFADIDLDSVEFLDRSWLKDEKAVYYYDHGPSGVGVRIVPGADPATFKHTYTFCYVQMTKYNFQAEDKDAYYYPPTYKNADFIRVSKDDVPGCESGSITPRINSIGAIFAWIFGLFRN